MRDRVSLLLTGLLTNLLTNSRNQGETSGLHKAGETRKPKRD
jgi:hypothetical protein